MKDNILICSLLTIKLFMDGLLRVILIRKFLITRTFYRWSDFCKHTGMKSLIAILLWCILLVMCWPVALVLIFIFPILWLLLLPFRIAGLLLEFIGAVLMFPFRVFGK